MKLRIASDHAGFELKEFIKKEFKEIEWIDLGTSNTDSTHYPSYAQRLCEDILDKTSRDDLRKQLGVLVCGSGIGMSMQANRYQGIRAALCWSAEVSKLSRQHNASNVLCLSGRLIDQGTNLQILKSWLSTEFEGGRHAQRIDMMDTDCDCC